MRSSKTFLLASSLLVGSAALADAEPLRLLRITPAGEDVPPERQILFQFDRDVVPLGRMQRNAAELPITIEPDPGCEWRWIDRSALACRLGEDDALVPATRYTIKVRPGILGPDGATLADEVRHTFVTKRPSIENVWAETWASPGTPSIRVVFDQEVEASSIARHLEFRERGGASVPADVRRPEEERDESQQEGRDGPREPRPTLWIVRPERELSADTPVALHIEPGVVPVRGNEPGVEDRDVVTFRTFPEPRFLGIRCWDLSRTHVLLVTTQSAKPTERCDPQAQIELLFASPVGEDQLRKHLQVEPPLAGDDPWAPFEPWSRLGWISDTHEYPVTLPGSFLAVTEYRLRGTAAIEDQFGRALPAPIDMRFVTDHRRPELVDLHPVSVLESQVDTRLPIVVQNLKQVHARFERLTAQGVSEGLGRDLTIPPAQDIAYRFPLEVRDWLDASSGALIGTLTSTPPTGPPQRFFSQVTPFQVHVKVGHYNTLVWVTDLASGDPVGGAEVEIVEDRLDGFDAAAPSRAHGTTDLDGIAELPGSAVLDPAAELITYSRDREKRHLILRVQRGADIAVVPLMREFRVEERGPEESWINVWRRPRHGHLRAWGTTAQGIYRAGDLVQYKVWVRNVGNETLEPAPSGAYALKVIDPLDRVVHERAGLTLDGFGGLDGELRVPKTGAVGWYRFELRADFWAEGVWQPLTVLVSDFTPAPFRVTTDLASELFRAGDTVSVTTTAALHAGGPYVDAETRVTGIVRTAPFEPEDPIAQSHSFDVGQAEEETIHSSESALDGRGERQTSFVVRAENVLYGELAVESAVRDDRGKYVADRAVARYAGRDRYVGVRQPDWVLEAGEPAELTAIVTDELGRIVPDVPVHITIERLVTQAARVKGAGNAYLTQYVHEWQAAGECTFASGAEPVACGFTPEAAGEHRLTATIEDTEGRPVASQLHRWAAGRGVVLWEEPPGHHLQIVPENKTLRVGETARYLIKNPFPGARALVTLERSGVIKRWITTLEDSTPILEFEVAPELIPGFHLSVLVTSPRVESPPGDGNGADLGKPAFRLGYAHTEVRDPYKELSVTARSSAEVLKPRERVVIEIAAETRQGDVPPMQFAVAVLDESVLDLLLEGAEGFDPYRGMYEPEPLDLWNFNLLKHLVGLQAFGKKGATPAGDGGMDPALRSVFKFVSYWNPALAADAEGRARIELEVPDNLTAWRVLVMAATEQDRFGLGQTSFRVNRPTEVRSALPNQVLEGDRFEARFTVMNRTDRPRKLVVTATARGAVRRPAKLKRVIQAKPFERRTVALEVVATEPGELNFEVRARDDIDADGLAVTVPVRRGVALETAAEFGSTVDSEVIEELRFPDDLREGVGHVAVSTSPTVIGSLDGAFRYMRDYPYLCWEQILSRGVMAAHYRASRDWLPRDLEWPGADTVPQDALASASDFQTPSGAMAYFQPLDEYASPYLSAYTALAFQWMREQGYAVPSGVEDKLHEYLAQLLRRDEFPSFFSRGMASSVRAVALAALARSGKVTLDDATRYRSHLQQMDLFGRAHYLEALAQLGAPDALRREARDSILAHAQESAGKVAFTESLDDGYQQLLHSELRTSCAVLGALIAEGKDALAAAGAAELPMKIVRSVTQTRDRSSHWENTQENLFCTAAVVAYAKVYESDSPSFTTTAELDGEKLGHATFEDRTAAAVSFERALRTGDRGRESEVRLTREGQGRLYYQVALSWSPAVLPTSPVDAGIEVRREYSVQRDGSWVALGNPAAVRAGELVRIDLFVVLPGPRNFVVLDDPVPGGLEPVNRDLATASLVDAREAEDVFPEDSFFHHYDDWQTYAMTLWSFHHRELRHDAARFYSEYLPAGRYRLSYVAQVIAPGTFTIPPTHAEEMYDPDVFGNGVGGTLDVRDSE